MAEEKKTSTRGRKPRKKRATPAPKKEGFSLRNEVKGIIGHRCCHTGIARLFLALI